MGTTVMEGNRQCANLKHASQLIDPEIPALEIYAKVIIIQTHKVIYMGIH